MNKNIVHYILSTNNIKKNKIHDHFNCNRPTLQRKQTKFIDEYI